MVTVSPGFAVSIAAWIDEPLFTVISLGGLVDRRLFTAARDGVVTALIAASTPVRTPSGSA